MALADKRIQKREYEKFVEDESGDISVRIVDPDRGIIDSVSGAAVSITHSHHEVHEGGAFTVSDVQSVDTTTIQWMITTPDSLKYSHMVFDMMSTGEMQMIITEGADRTGTNALVEVNRCRVGTPDVATTIVHRGASGGSTDGSVIISFRGGATGLGANTGTPGGGRGENEWVLKPNTKYIITVTTYATVFVTAHFDWYEHVDLT